MTGGANAPINQIGLSNYSCETLIQLFSRLMHLLAATIARLSCQPHL